MLDLEAATIPCPSARGRQIDEARISRLPAESLVSKIIAEGETAVWAARPIADEGGEVELVAGKSRRVVWKLLLA